MSSPSKKNCMNILAHLSLSRPNCRLSPNFSGPQVLLHKVWTLILGTHFLQISGLQARFLSPSLLTESKLLPRQIRLAYPWLRKRIISLFKIILLLLSLFTGGNIFPFRRFPLNGANHVLKTYIFLTPSGERGRRVNLRQDCSCGISQKKMSYQHNLIIRARLITSSLLK